MDYLAWQHFSGVDYFRMKRVTGKGDSFRPLIIKLTPMNGISVLSEKILWEKKNFFCKSLKNNT
jgi:hypothetical protein